MTRIHVVIIGMVGMVCACSSGPKSAAAPSSDDFECKDRMATYTVTGGFAAAEVGVKMMCSGKSAMVSRWTTAKDGTQDKKQASMPVDTFDAIWKKIESTGWQELKDCDSPASGTHQPIYQYEVKDHERSAEFNCQARRDELPFPWADLANELDTAARNHLR